MQYPSIRQLPSAPPPRLFVLGYPDAPLSTPPTPFSSGYWFQPHLGECPYELADTVGDDNRAGPDSRSMFCSTPLAATFRPLDADCHPTPLAYPLGCHVGCGQRQAVKR